MLIMLKPLSVCLRVYCSARLTSTGSTAPGEKRPENNICRFFQHIFVLPVVICFISITYAWTWCGGYLYHHKEISNQALNIHSSAINDHIEFKEKCKKFGLEEPENDIYKRIHKKGPSAVVNWCVPVFPGILIANSYYIIGPLWELGGVKVVLFYGFGTKELLTLFGWIS